MFIDGQAAAAEKLSKRITKKTNAIKVNVAKYNAALSVWKDPIPGMPEIIAFEEVKDPESLFYSHLKVGETQENLIPFDVKRNVIDLHNFVERCKEETEYLHTEVLRLIEHFFKMKCSCESSIDELRQDTSALTVLCPS